MSFAVVKSFVRMKSGHSDLLHLAEEETTPPAAKTSKDLSWGSYRNPMMSEERLCSELLKRPL